MRGTGVNIGRYLFQLPKQAKLRELLFQRWTKNDKYAYRGRCVGRLVVIENARHAVTAERPEQFNAVFEKILADLGD